ncbi:hypothetical protein OAL51_01080 [bacterium]|nr:hypothetical protein [Akkermansiaceae bacterium]MDA7530450.1 hypothetical protein [bacterium]MDA7532637.1 hypothetical protein [Akkermansiaceae bacterium]MDA7655808.1 hypothetical protein [Akkermansiaceae bacterium]MDA7661574.1 hypothetical protein [bacterium]
MLFKKGSSVADNNTRGSYKNGVNNFEERGHGCPWFYVSLLVALFLVMRF